MWSSSSTDGTMELHAGQGTGRMPHVSWCVSTCTSKQYLHEMRGWKKWNTK
jgi:hypothetical protein